MLYYDYIWDLSSAGIQLDSELDTAKLNWQPGDYFELVNLPNGGQALRRLTKLEKFVNGESVNV